MQVAIMPTEAVSKLDILFTSDTDRAAMKELVG